jgi:MFS family permease
VSAELSERRRTVALAAMVAAVAVVTLDTTILNVAIPTIARDLHTGLRSLQWVVAGYSLTLGSLLIIGGRLGDVIGVRRAFAVGAMLFAVGSSLASVATSTPQLVWGEAIIEGIGASLLFPASLAALSMTFQGAARAKAFAVWGGVGGAAAALGPVVGGWLTSDFSWRWGFRINVVVAPLAALAALAALPRDAGNRRGWRIDARGALLLAAGLFMVVFALTEAPDHGWIVNHGGGVALGPLSFWSRDWSVSPAAAAVVIAAFCLVRFVRVERTGREPLVDLSLFGRRTFSGGLMTAMAVVMAQAGTMFALAVYLQTAHHLSAISAGRWLVPVGVGALIGARTGGRRAAIRGPVTVVRTGLAVELAGVLSAAAVLGPHVAWAPVAAALIGFGFGAGMASSQLTNVVLSEVAWNKAGAASGVSTTNNALGAALGVAILGAVLRTGGVSTDSARLSLLTGAALLAVGAAVSFTIGTRRSQPTAAAPDEVEGLEGASHGAA